MTLAERQREFMAALVGDAPGRWGLETYRRNAFANWHDALAAAYPVVRRLVGEAFFREAARRHALAFPSTSGDLHDYGARFAGFLAAYPHAAGLPYLPDVARLERALVESAAAAEATVLDFGALAAIPPADHPRLVLRVNPSVRLLETPHPVLAIWEANQPDRDGTPEGGGGGEHLLVARRDGQATAARLDARDWRFLARLARGETLDAAVDSLEDAAPRIQRLLPAWAAEGLFCGFAIA